MKKSGEDRLKYVVYESTLSTADAVPLPRWGRQKGGGFAAFFIRSSQVGDIRQYPSAAGAVPLPQTITPCGATVNESH